MSERNLANWIRKEHDLVTQLADRLHEKVAVVPRSCTERWIHEVRDQFEHFRAHLHKHMAMEEEGGYMTSVVELRPSLGRRVDRLLCEHRDLTTILTHLHGLFDEVKPENRLLLRDVCRRVEDLLSYVDRHEQEENDLVSFAFTDEIGTKD